MTPLSLGIGLGIGMGGGLAQALPSSLANLVAWGEGSDLGNDGTSIASWLNKTLSGLDPAQGTGANQPTVKANAINGQKAALFTAASNQGLVFPAGALGWFQNVSGFTLIAVAQSASSQAGSPLLLRVERGTTASPRGQIAVQPASGHFQSSSMRVDGDAATTLIGGVPTVGTPFIAGNISDFSVPSEMLMVAGASVATGTPTGPGNTSNTASLGISIGNRYDLGSGAFDGYIAAYAMWNAAYTIAQLRPVLNRWSVIYGIPLL